MQTLKKYPLLVIFTLLLGGLTIADMFWPIRDFSEMENRPLAQRPAFSLQQLLRNEYTPKYESFINDQFAARDGWIMLKSITESALGKIENNGVVYGADGRMFENYPQTDERRLNMNTEFVAQFAQTLPENVHLTVSIAPNAYTLFPEALPRGLHNVDQLTVIADVYAALPPQADALDLYPALHAAIDQAQSVPLAGAPDPVYYRTDHHWTTFGAYSAYRAFAQSRGLAYATLSDLQDYRREQSDFYGSYYSKSKLFSAKPDTIAYYELPFDSLEVDGERKSTLHNSAQWQARDRHAAFLWGNNGLTVLRAQNNLNHTEAKTSRILLIKDSYSNSLAPFLTYSYDEVYIIDLRYYTGKLSELLEQQAFDDVFILYNFMNFTSDTNVYKLLD